jgi:hypothetical protein
MVTSLFDFSVIGVMVLYRQHWMWASRLFKVFSWDHEEINSGIFSEVMFEIKAIYFQSEHIAQTW